jgi:hypothetical protein
MKAPNNPVLFWEPAIWDKDPHFHEPMIAQVIIAGRPSGGRCDAIVSNVQNATGKNRGISQKHFMPVFRLGVAIVPTLLFRFVVEWSEFERARLPGFYWLARPDDVVQSSALAKSSHSGPYHAAPTDRATGQRIC